MNFKVFCALCTESTVVYEIIEYKNHFFRKYPDGHITKVDENDMDAIAILQKRRQS